MQYRWRTSDLEFACELLDTLLAHYEDPRGGFFFTADDHEKLLHKPKPFADEAVPSGNGKAAVALLSLGHLLGEQRYLDAAERTVRAAMYGVQRYPEGHATLLQALAGLVTPPELVVVRAPAAALDAWQRELHAGYHPHRLSFAIPSEESQLPGLLAERTPQGAATAYLCEGTTCRTPITDIATLRTALTP